jgi:hypothetical protein
LAVALAGCAGLLGIEDRTADDSDGSVDGGLQSDGAVAPAAETGAALESAAPDASVPEPDATTPKDAQTASDGHGGGADAGGGGDAPLGSDSSSGSDAQVPMDVQVPKDVQPPVDVQAPPVDAGSCADPCPIKTGLNNPWTITSDANRVYWTEYGSDVGTDDGAVKSCPIAGCDSGLIVYTQSQINPRGIALDGTNVYWTAQGGIWSCAIGGCTNPTKVATAVFPQGITVDSTYVYWTENDDESVRRIPKTGGGGGAGTVLYMYDYNAVDGGALYDPEQCVVDPGFIYSTDMNGDVVRISLTDGTQFLLGTAPIGGSFGIAMDSNSIYYGEVLTIMATRKDSTVSGGGTSIANDVYWPSSLALDPAGGTIYWADFGTDMAGVNDGTVGRVNIDGTGEKVLEANLATPHSVTVSGNYVFWDSLGKASDTTFTGAVAGTGAVYRTAK